jgi:hypothetical protein
MYVWTLNRCIIVKGADRVVVWRADPNLPSSVDTALETGPICGAIKLVTMDTDRFYKQIASGKIKKPLPLKCG